MKYKTKHHLLSLNKTIETPLKKIHYFFQLKIPKDDSQHI